MAYSVAAWLATLAFPELLIRLFNDDPVLIADGVPAFRIYLATFACMSFQMIGQSIFVGLGGPGKPSSSLSRKAFIVAPLRCFSPPALGWG